jgi:hypothetical protein
MDSQLQEGRSGGGAPPSMPQRSPMLNPSLRLSQEVRTKPSLMKQKVQQKAGGEGASVAPVKPEYSKVQVMVS